jgi:hypothetical protein
MGHPIKIRKVAAIGGPRAGALEVDAGVDVGKLRRALGKDDAALVRQFIPWAFVGEPAVFMSGRFLRLEAGWPPDLAETDIPLGNLGRHPTGKGRWIAGKNEFGVTITLGIDSSNPHYLFGGQTGSGKTWALRSALVQLAQDPENRLILIDAKWGDGLGGLRGLPGLVGPVADDPWEARAALSWAARQMRLRYEGEIRDGLIVIGIDEVQELQEDPATVELLRKIVSLGRGAGVHVLLGTQHPTKDALGDSSVKRNLTGRVALKVEDGVASNVVVGGPAPRADHLLGAGDAYAVVPGRVQRLQMAYVPERDLKQYAQAGAYSLEVWPEINPAEALGRLPDDAGDHVSGSDEPAEVGAAIEAAYRGRGRPWLRDRIKEETGNRPGNEKAARLLSLGRDVYQWLGETGLSLVDSHAQPTSPNPQPWVDGEGEVW